ncbi:MAG TPA: hypothetical protein VM934_15455 [Pyrinomonadaceae bacterium]|jgi:hypothetical protein|nr:hypothetical protein [Pyrinomonadaceae bacterium]
MTKIAKIVKSNSHVDYVGRVIDRLDAVAPPEPDDYGFAQFVSVPIEGAGEAVGIIYNTLLANPDYGNFGPRLSSHAELAILSPDYLNEQGVLVGILLLGWRDAGSGDGRDGVSSNGGDRDHRANWHGVPRRVIPVGQDVYALGEREVDEFHRGADGSVQLHYYSQIIAHAGAFALPLIEAVLDQLDPACSREERQRLCVLKKSLAWQRTLGGMRL